VQRLFHFSEDPTIELFIPHVARTSDEKEPFVWAVDEMHAPSYWFPRDCPRICCWKTGSQSECGDSLLALGGAHRLHALEHEWVERFRQCQLYVYEFDSAPFMPQVPGAGYWATRNNIVPLSVKPVGNLLTRHVEAGIELRIVKNLWPLIDVVVASGLEFSIIRKANAQPRQL
jgi:Family of unknown function (DUF6886)